MEKSKRTKPGVELDKFKRRLIRSVARLLLHEKKPEAEIWKELKKETGCDCELLWTRMRALTLKKLDHLLAANDCMDALPNAARMSLTDWLLFDLVLVHQKIDLIGQDDNKEWEDRKVLVELFRLVKKFNLECQSGDKLTEAWSLATLYYNKKGHHCSPMLLQRRWYQLKEVTRYKFYNFWYAYRGNLTRIEFAERYRPSALQTEIAKTFKLLVTEPFLEWDELIKRGLVSLPQEFERKMKERAALRRPVPQPTEDVPDLVMIEPSIETIDLRLEPDEDMDENNKQEEEAGEVIPPPVITIKEEPQDDIEVDETQLQPPKKSLYEVVLERTALENEELDSMGAADLNPENNDVDMEIQEIVREELALPQIASVFGNVSDTSVLAKIDENKVYSSAENTVSSNAHDACDDSVIASGNENRSSNSNNYDPNSSQNDDAVIEVSSDNKEDDICDNAEKITLDGGVSDEVNEISDNDNSGNLDANNDVDIGEETSVTANAPETNITANVEETNVCDNVISNVINTSVTGPAEISSDVVKTNVTCEAAVVGAAVEASITEVSGNVNETSMTAYSRATKLAVNQNAPAINVETTFPSIVAALKAPSVTNTTEVIKDIEIIESTSEPVMIMDSDDDDHHVDDLVIYKPLPASTEGENKDQPMEVDSTVEDLDIPSTEPLKVENVTEHAVEVKDTAEEKVEMDIKPDVKSFNFGELSNDISFVDEGIEFVDDGIVYVDEDSHTETTIKCEKEDEGEDTPKIDVKLLMCPVIYTTRLDDMGIINAQINNMYVSDKHLIDSIIKKSKPIKQEPKNESKDTVENITINYCGENIDSITVNDMKKTIEYVQKNVDEQVLVKDSIIIKKENAVPIEDIRNQNIVNVESENDTKEIYDDDEENFIDESLKVKPTSYLLQKPRSRTYHPYQLCKNPDFNTRLRRLSVAFFGSPRNRALIKSCKPLTIDLSKAFESKLLSGTLYLKPADHNTVTKTETIDDSRSHVSVVPSAMPAQSLIDNSKVADILPMLHQSLQVSKQPENVVPTSERNKVINLPDITEIRRINQRLLTAEVTPIQVQNNQPQVPVTIVTTSSNTSTNPAETRTIAETNTDLRSIVPEATDARGPPKLLEITDDSPSKKNQNSAIYDFRQFSRPTTVIWKPRHFRPEIPWLSRKNQVAYTNSNKKDETLLTLDALNKMLFILTDKLEPEQLAPRKPKPKPKRKNKDLPPKQRGRPKTNKSDTEYLVLIRKAIEEDREQSSTTDALLKWQNPRFNIKAATNGPSDRAVCTTGTGTDKSKKKIKYCCWARQRMLQLLFCRETIPPHDCPRKCKCCCSNLLRDYTIHEQKIKQNELVKAVTSLETVSKRTLSPIQSSVKVPDVEIVNDSNGESIQCLSVGMEPVPEQTPPIDVDAVYTESTANTTTQIEPIDVEAIDTEGDVPAPSVQVSVTTTSEVKKLAGRGLEAPVNVLAKPKLAAVPNVNGDKAEIRYHNFISCAAPQVAEPGNLYISSDYHSGGVILNAMNSTAVTPISSSPPILEKLSAIKKSKMPNRYKTITPRPPIANKPFDPPKIFKEKMIFLNSKQISEKPSKSPVFLGKNKILLTTVKFPPNLNLFEEARKALRSTLKLPDGVRLVLLTDGTIVYKIDENVAVDATDVMKVPGIIATVQAYMNTKAAQEETLKNQKGVKESEVVDLIDDEDESVPNASNIENNEIPLRIENQTIEETVSNDNNLEMNMSNETEENQIDSNINSDVTETESHEKDSADQHTVTEIQKDVREASQNETLSLSTEQLHNQSEQTRQIVIAEKDEQPDRETESAEIDDQPKSSSQDELTDAHLVSSEQTAHNQSDPTRQIVIAEKDEQPDRETESAEIDDQPKSSSQDELTDAHLVSSEQTAQNQSDPTRQIVVAEKDEQPDRETESAEIDDQPKSSSQDEFTDAHLVSSEQTAQNQSDPTRQIVIAEKDEQPQSSNQTGSTDEHEGPSEQAQNQLDPTTLAVNAEKNDESKLLSQADLLTDGREVSSEQAQNQSKQLSQNVSIEVKDHIETAEQAQNQSEQSSRNVSIEVKDHIETAEQAQNQSEQSSRNVSTEVKDHIETAEQAQNQSEQSSQNVSIEVKDHIETAEQAQNQSEQSSQHVSIEVKDHIETAAPEESTSEPSRPKTKNILSDLMEMSGIFDEDITSEIEETQLVGTHAAQAAGQTVLGQVSLVAALPEPQLEQPPAPVSAETSLIRPILIPPNFNSDHPLAPKLRTPLSDLTPITSLYELKYACANNGTFFKLDFETGYLVPINVCMKPTVVKPTLLKPLQPPVRTLRTIAPKSVIDLTEDDDNPEQKDTEPDTSPSKGSVLIVNSAPKNFSGPVKPVKMFKALKPSILRRLNQGKINLDGQDPQIRSSLDHKLKRKQFLEKINLNADLSDTGAVQIVPVKRYVNKIIVKRSSIIKNKVTEGDEPTPTTSRAEPYKEFATTISSNDDSSDDEPLAKIAKRIHGNAPVEDKNASESGTKHNDLGLSAADVQPEAVLGEKTDSELPAADVQPEAVLGEQTDSELPATDIQPEAVFEEQTDSELPAADVQPEAVFEEQTDSELPAADVQPEAVFEEQTESELPVADAETMDMSDDCNDEIDLQMAFGFESNEEEENCILGV